MNRCSACRGLATLGLCGLLLSAHANDITVDTTGDSTSGCTLRYAMDNANNNAQTHAACASGNGADTIKFDSTVFASPQTITVGSTLPILTDPDATTIDGGNVVTVSGADKVKVFSVGDLGSGAGAAVFRNIVVAHGAGASAYGGGVYMVGTSLELDNVTLSHNFATFGGGGVYMQHGTTTVDGCLFTGNSSSLGGGFYFNGSSGVSAQILNSTFSGNSGASDGGGIFSGNGGTLSVTNSTFNGNTSASYGGAIRNYSVVALTLDYVTVSGNTAGSIISPGGAVDVENDATISVSNSIIAGNTYGDCRDTTSSGPGLTDSGNNFFGDSTCNGVADGDPMLGPLGYSAGPTPTMVPLSGSPVIDAALCEMAVATDQRGVQRPQGAGCDIGAVEVETSIFADGFEMPAM